MSVIFSLKPVCVYVLIDCALSMPHGQSYGRGPTLFVCLVLWAPYDSNGLIMFALWFVPLTCSFFFNFHFTSIGSHKKAVNCFGLFAWFYQLECLPLLPFHLFFKYHKSVPNWHIPTHFIENLARVTKPETIAIKFHNYHFHQHKDWSTKW